MPELPEVETIKRDLASLVVGHKITGTSFLWPGILKDMPTDTFGEIVKGKKIIGVERRAKNLYLELTGGVYLLFHMKMTGHLIYTDDTWKVDQSGKWIKSESQDSPMHDPLNQYIRMLFILDGGKILAFSDLRKFAYLKLLDKEGLTAALSGYGPEPLSEDFKLDEFTKLLQKRGVAIKKLLMDPKNVAGIGNIYADEILWLSKIHPLTPGNKLTDSEIKTIFESIRLILTRAIKARGTSVSDFRDTKGKKGEFGLMLNVYRRTGLPCPRDGVPIERIVVGGRGTHFCPKEQIRK